MNRVSAVMDCSYNGSDTAGDYSLAEGYGVANDDTLQSAEELPDHGLLATGSTFSFGLGEDYWLMKLNSDGSIAGTCGAIVSSLISGQNTTAIPKKTKTSVTEPALSFASLAPVPSSFTVVTGQTCGSACPVMVINPAIIPSLAFNGVSYDQAISCNGGETPIVFSVNSGALPSGISLSGAGDLSGTPDTDGSYAFDLMATDNTGCTVTHPFSMNVVTCMFCDEFEDGILDATWDYQSGTWSESGGKLSGSSSGKAVAVLPSSFPGCGMCSVETTVTSSGGTGNQIRLLGWDVDKKNNVELLMKEQADRWILKQRSLGNVVSVSKAASVINPNTPYHVKLQFDGLFRVYVDSVLIISVPPASGVATNGTFGLESKATTASFENIAIY